MCLSRHHLVTTVFRQQQLWRKAWYGYEQWKGELLMMEIHNWIFQGRLWADAIVTTSWGHQMVYGPNPRVDLQTVSASHLYFLIFVCRLCLVGCRANSAHCVVTSWVRLVPVQLVFMWLLIDSAFGYQTWHLSLCWITFSVTESGLRPVEYSVGLYSSTVAFISIMFLVFWLPSHH